MMVLFHIFKIIGIIIAVLLLLVVVILAAVLFVPVQYRVKARRDEKVQYLDAGVNWLFIRFCHAIYRDGHFRYGYKIPFVASYDSQKEEKEKAAQKAKAETSRSEAPKAETIQAEASRTEMTKTETEMPETTRSEPAGTEITQAGTIRAENSRSDKTTPETDMEWRDVSGRHVDDAADDIPTEGIPTEGISADHKKGNFRLSDILNAINEQVDSIKSKYKGFLRIFGRIREGFEALARKIDAIKKVHSSDDGVYSEAVLLKNIQYLIKVIKPKVFKGKFRYGMPDPHDTGMIYAGLCLFYPVYFRKLYITPDFEKQCFEGNLNIRGHIMVFSVVKTAVVLFFDKRLKAWLKDAKTAIVSGG